MKKTIVVMATIAMALGTAPSAFAHAQISSSYPKNGSIVKTWPDRIWAEFDGNLIQIPGKSVNQMVITDSKGKQVALKSLSVGGARLTAFTEKAATSGKITVTNRVVSEDGHPVIRIFTFFYNPKKDR